MSELFDNAKFGDKFKTRDGKLAIYDRCTAWSVDKPHILLVEDYGISSYSENGSYNSGEEFQFDIVSRWEESE